MHATQASIPDAPRRRVLAVDDCATMRLLLQAALEAHGYSVQVVDSGQAALQAAGDGPFDAIVLDIEMPGLDGMAVGRALRQHPLTASTLIALHTSLQEADVRPGFDQYDDFVPKLPGRAGLLGLGARLHSLIQARQRPAAALSSADER